MCDIGGGDAHTRICSLECTLSNWDWSSPMKNIKANLPATKTSALLLGIGLPTVTAALYSGTRARGADSIRDAAENAKSCAVSSVSRPWALSDHTMGLSNTLR
ncbi:hypothetical protein M406DRAFT_76080 [Cryphonectria parasitica EP155]|uniref:Uncharacterized protein n=1 Tax=Cryphonectria parasitica (strain ATCC 38755 / EP155) TaxID=660469 RepID=A0A9P4XTL5_CRYP1|nr:uncharacterized protein M406DRAFT_76080 [Cryphonectria parasitica EP155]KAF3760425.1 hypothetical protein M406DRAFT_76080 [Cryphonectria parasitica EP155]